MNYRCDRMTKRQRGGPLHPAPNRHENSTAWQRIKKPPVVLEIQRLGIAVLHCCSLPIGAGMPWRNHSTTATSGSLCCHRGSFQRSFATSSRCSLCSLGHCACRLGRAPCDPFTCIHFGISKVKYCCFIQHTKFGGKANGCADR